MKVGIDISTSTCYNRIKIRERELINMENEYYLIIFTKTKDDTTVKMLNKYSDIRRWRAYYRYYGKIVEIINHKRKRADIYV